MDTMTAKVGDRAAPLAWSAFALTVTSVLLTILLGAGLEGAFDLVAYGLLTMALAASGLLVVSRERGHPIGWLFCALAVYGALAEVAEAYGVRAAESGWPAGEVGEWIISWSWIGEITVWMFVFVLFPDGRLPARRWRVALWLAVAGCALAVPGYALSSSEDASFSGGENPFAVDSPIIGVLFAVGMALIFAALLASIVSLVLRLRRARGLERAQLKWFAYGAASVGLVAPFALALWNQTIVVEVLMALALIGLPTAAGIAMLRYRLYDIDVVINRTLVYGVLSATLAGAYLGSVLLLQLVLSGVTEGSGLAVAASTLAVAGLFRPARSRIQELVDRRFYRRKYDAARTLESFGTRLRDEVDLDAVAGDLRGVVAETMQPAHVSLWLRGAPR